MGFWFQDVGSLNHEATNHRASLSPFEFPGDPRESITGTYKVPGQNDAYARSATLDSSGKLRLTRTAGVFSSYYWDVGAGQWALLLTGGQNTADLPLALYAWSSDTEWQHGDVMVAFDNFVMNCGQLACP
jgi:hypothetical protein